VGILAAALYRPLWTATVKAPADYALVVAASLALIIGKLRPWIVVCIIAACARSPALWPMTRQS
jgi:chromate transporter